MPYGTIAGSIAGQTFAPRTTGSYVLSSLSFSEPTNEFRITGASVRRDGTRGGVISRLLQKDVTVAGSAVRRQMLISLSITVPNDGTFTATEIDQAIADISQFATPEVVSRFMQGEA